MPKLGRRKFCIPLLSHPMDLDLAKYKSWIFIPKGERKKIIDFYRVLIKILKSGL